MKPALVFALVLKRYGLVGRVVSSITHTSVLGLLRISLSINDLHAVPLCLPGTNIWSNGA
jgi:hypothetical protein